MLLGIRWRSMRAKIIAWSFVPTAAILLAVAWVTFNAYQQVTEDLVIERNRELTRLSTGEFAAGLAEYTGLLKSYTVLLAELARSAFIFENDPQAQHKALRRASGQLRVFDAGVIVTNSRGTVVAAEPERPDALGQNWSDRPYFRVMLRSPRAVFSDITADGPNGAEVIVVAVPIQGDQGQFQGIIAGMFHLGANIANKFNTDIARLQVGEEERAFLVDGSGRLIYHADASRIGEDLSGRPVVQQVTQGQVGALRTRDIDDREIVASFAPVPGTSWGLVIHESWNSLIRSGQGYRQFLLLLLGLGIVVPAVVVAIGVKRITRPITDLIGAAQEVASGDFNQRIKARTGDEVEELAEQFNRMAGKLQESYTRLERQVHDRTRELAALNNIAVSVSGSLDLDAVLDEALDEVLQVIEVEIGGIYLLDEESSTLNIVVHRGLAPDLVAEIDNLKLGEGFSGYVARTGRPLVVPNIATDSRLTRMVLDEEELRCLASVPVLFKGEVLGTMFAVSRRNQEFASFDVQLLSSIGHQIGVAIGHARLLKAERRQRKEATLLAEMAKLISGTLDLDRVLRLTAEYAVDVFDVTCSSIFLCEDGDGALRPAAQIGLDDASAAACSAAKFLPSETMRQTVFADLQALIVEDVPTDPHLIPSERLDLQSALVVPIEVGGRRLGALQLGTRRPVRRRFTAREGELALTMANHAAVAIDNARLFKAEKRRAEQFRVISKVGRRITSILAVDELLDQMARLIHTAFQYDHVSFGLIEGDMVVFEPGVVPKWEPEKSLRLKVGHEGVAGWVAGSGKPLLVSDVSQEPRYLSVPQTAESRSELCVPLKTKDAVIGVLDVQSHQIDAFDESDLTVLRSLADQAAVAIENARLFRDADRQVRELRGLADASRIISSVLDQDQLLQALYEQIARIMPTEFYVIALYDEETNVVSIEICVDEGVQYLKEQYVLDKGLLQLIIQDRRPLLFHSLTEEKHTLDIETVPSGSDKANHGWLGVPMLYGDKVVGAIVVGSYQRGVFDQGHQQTLMSIANQAAVALENARLYEQAQQLAALEERQRLARDLHDAVTQTLFSASLIAEALPAVWDIDQQEGRHLLKELRQLSRGALAEMRTLLLELRPATLAEAGLPDLLHQLAEAVTGRTGIPVELMVQGVCALPSEVHVTLYRIAQEALNNVVKHAHASRVTVDLRYGQPTGPGRRAELCVSDDGRGFNPDGIPTDRLGLRIIRERAQTVGAALQIQAQQGQGTMVSVVWEEQEREQTT